MAHRLDGSPVLVMYEEFRMKSAIRHLNSSNGGVGGGGGVPTSEVILHPETVELHGLNQQQELE